jgi:hypothetical protein
MGRATDPWRAAETWIRCLASHSIPLHAAKGLSAHPEMAHLPAEPNICDRCDRFRRSRSAIRRPPRMVHASCPVRHQGAGWPALQAYRAIVDLAPVAAMWLFQSCRSALHPKALRARLLRDPSKRRPLDLASRRLSPYRSRASPRRKLSGIRHTIIRYRAQSQAGHNSFTAIALCVCHEQSETPQKACSKKVKIFKACRYLVIPPQFGYRGQGYEKRQPK